jgi:hypothetical protein
MKQTYIFTEQLMPSYLHTCIYFGGMTPRLTFVNDYNPVFSYTRYFKSRTIRKGGGDWNTIGNAINFFYFYRVFLCEIMWYGYGAQV